MQSAQTYCRAELEVFYLWQVEAAEARPDMEWKGGINGQWTHPEPLTYEKVDEERRLISCDLAAISHGLRSLSCSLSLCALSLSGWPRTPRLLRRRWRCAPHRLTS